MAAVTLITVQNTQRVSRVEPLSAELVREQVTAVVQDIPPGAAKTGSLGTAENIEVVADLAAGWRFPLVVDPVMISKHGAPLLAEAAQSVLVSRLLPVCALVTPNLPEAEALTGRRIEDEEGMREAARRIAALGPGAVLLKGGHLEGEAVDFLFSAGVFLRFPGPRIPTQNTHGTGCTYSAAITAGLARGLTLEAAVSAAKRYITAAIERNPGLGGGYGPVEHHTPVDLS